MKQKLLLFLLVLLPMAANAYDAYINGIYYNFYSDYYGAEVTYQKYQNGIYTSDYSGAVVIPKSVTYNGKTYSVINIDSHAFRNCSSLTSITIPNSVTNIYNYAFSKCTSLTSITIPNGVTSIGDFTFEGCSSLTSITIPESVTSIGINAFYGCSGLTSVTIPNSVISIGGGTFQKCTSLTSFTIPNCMSSSIPSNTFSGCTGLTSITIPNSVTSIDSYAFNNCSSLTSITIPESVTSIGSYAFANCTKITSVTIPNSVVSIDDYAFSGCNSLTSVSIGNNVISIGWGAFSGCTSLKSVTIPEGVSCISEAAFFQCINLTSITIPESVTSIGTSAFYGCISLTSITIPNSVTSISSEAFYGCYFTEEYFHNNSALTDNNMWGATICDEETSDRILIKDNSVVRCRPMATSATIPYNVTSIGDNAFALCFNLTSITIPSSVTNIGSLAFESCPSLSQVKVYMEKPVKCSSPFMYSPISSATLYVPYGCSAAYMADASWNGFGEIIEMQNPDEITIGSSGVATFASPNALDFSEITNVKAYVASSFDSETNTLVLTRVKESPAGEGLFVVGEPGSYVIPEKTTDATYSNLLRGVTYPTYLSTSDGEHTNFILANGSHGLGFYTLTKAGELAAGKAYLQLPVSDATEVKALSIIDDEETAVTSLLDDKPERNDIYNLQGQRVSQAKHGLYIMNGKKVFNR